MLLQNLVTFLRVLTLLYKVSRELNQNVNAYTHNLNDSSFNVLHNG